MGSRFKLRQLQNQNLMNGAIRISPKRIEYILEWNLLEKSVKRPFCCTVSILQVYFTYLCYITFWALEHHFIDLKSKINIKRKPNYEIGGFIIDQ